MTPLISMLGLPASRLFLRMEFAWQECVVYWYSIQ
jgi:hypothetical protein